jgi:hypothetical protein
MPTNQECKIALLLAQCPGINQNALYDGCLLGFGDVGQCPLCNLFNSTPQKLKRYILRRWLMQCPRPQLETVASEAQRLHST